MYSYGITKDMCGNIQNIIKHLLRFENVPKGDVYKLYCIIGFVKTSTKWKYDRIKHFLGRYGDPVLREECDYKILIQEFIIREKIRKLNRTLNKMCEKI